MDGTKLKVHNVEPNLGHLLTERQVIEMLGLQDRKSPGASLQWLRRSRQLGFVRIGRGIYAYPEDDARRFMSERYQAPKALD